MKKQARKATQKYHIKLYTDKKLFQEGSSWLEKSNERIIQIAKENFVNRKNVRILDLGSGVGRNAIPIAELIKNLNGQIVCVDYLDIAINKLNEYAKECKVGNAIKGIVSSVEDFVIEPDAYDFIIAHSVLAHVGNKKKMVQVIKNMTKGTKKNGINYIYMITSPREFDAETGKEQDPEAEIEISFKEASVLLQDTYKGWEIQALNKNHYEEKLEKRGKEVIWHSDYLLFIAKNTTY